MGDWDVVAKEPVAKTAAPPGGGWAVVSKTPIEAKGWNVVAKEPAVTAPLAGGGQVPAKPSAPPAGPGFFGKVADALKEGFGDQPLVSEDTERTMRNGPGGALMGSANAWYELAGRVTNAMLSGGVEATKGVLTKLGMDETKADQLARDLGIISQVSPALGMEAGHSPSLSGSVPVKTGATDLSPAIRKPAGEVVKGEQGKVHNDIPGITENDQRGFVGAGGRFLNRKEAGTRAQAAGLDVPKVLHSEDLNAVREEQKTGPFGPVYPQFAGKPQEAVQHLLKERKGEATGALSHPNIGPIDLPWGEVGTGPKTGFGLSKIEARHPEVVADLQGILSRMQVTERSPNRVKLQDAEHHAIVRLDWDGKAKTWLLTQFKKAPGSAGKRTDTSSLGRGGDTALPATDPAQGNISPKLDFSKAAAAGPEDVIGRPGEGPLSHDPALQQPRSFEDQLFQLSTLGRADKIEVMKRLKDIPEGVKPETWEKLYHFEEDPKGVRLTPEEQALYDTHVKPIAAEADRLSAQLERLGYPVDKVETQPGVIAQIDKVTGELENTPPGERLPSGQGYTPRYVSGRTRSFGEMLDRWKQGVETKFGGAPGRSMRKTADAQNRRKFFLAVDTDGEQHVVYVAPGGDVLPFRENFNGHEFDLGPMGTVKGKIAPGSKFMDGSSNTWHLENATTKQIEEVARTRFSKNLVANRLDNLAKLRAAVRNADFIERMKASPDWGKVAVSVKDAPEPPKTGGRPWRVPQRPLQFRGYYMEPRLADALEDFGGQVARDAEGLVSGLDKAANVVKGSIFWWPLPHMLNEFDHYVVARGLVGGATGLATGRSPRAMIRAIRAVATQNEDYMRVLRSGASLPYSDLLTRDLHKALVAKLGEAVKTQPEAWQRVATIFGYANPINMIKGIYGASSRALWSATDALHLASIFEEMDKGLSLEKAIKHVEEHQPNYRIPGQVMGSRFASEVLQNPLFTMFGRYQYNRLASYGNMVRQLVARVPMAERAEALDKLAMLGFMVFVAYPALDEVAKKLTGNPNASVERPGASKVPQTVIEAVKGERTIPESVRSVFSPGPIFDTAPELINGNYGYSGQPVLRLDDLKRGDEQFLYDLFRWIGTKIQPLGMVSSAIEGRQSPKQQLERMFLLKDPTPEQVENKERWKQRDTVAAQKRDARERNKRAGVMQQEMAQ